MQSNIENKNTEESVKVNNTLNPDEYAGLHMQAKIKIFDPESEEVFIEQRG